MKDSAIDSLNEAFGIEGMLEFRSGPGGLPFAKLITPLATTEVCLQGAHATSFLPRASPEVLG